MEGVPLAGARAAMVHPLVYHGRRSDGGGCGRAGAARRMREQVVDGAEADASLVGAEAGAWGRGAGAGFALMELTLSVLACLIFRKMAASNLHRDRG